MKTWLITWNPNRWYWDLATDLAALKSQAFLDHRWSCGRTKSIVSGDRIFLIRLGVEPRGIMASGQVTSPPEKQEHWDRHRGGDALFIQVRFDALVDPESDGVLSLNQLQSSPLDSVHWNTQTSGITINPKAASELERLWREFLVNHGHFPADIPEEIATPAQYYEGSSRTIAVNTYERDSRARKACIDTYGLTCFVCGFDFSAKYGSLGEGYIHVHHLKPLSQIRKGYVVDPALDLRPVCPNCHAMLHRGPNVISIEELQKIVKLNCQKASSG